MKKQIEIKKISTRYWLAHTQGERIEAKVYDKYISLYRRDGRRDFVFAESDPERVHRIAELMMEASRLTL